MTVSPLDLLIRDQLTAPPARRWLADHGWPRARDEAWRYAPLAAITAAVDAVHHQPAGGLAELLVGLPPGPRVVLVDGRYRPDLSNVTVGDGLTVEFGAAAGQFRTDATDAFEAANHLATPGTTRIHVVGNRSTSVAVHLVHLTVDRQSASPRTEVTVASDGHVELIETFRTHPHAGLTNAATTIELAPGSRVDHLRVLQGASGAAHVGRTDFVAHESASVRAAALAAGPGASRHTVAATIVGDGGAVTLAGLCVPAAGAHHDTAVSVAHRASGATSRQRYVAIVPDRGRASFTGHVIVAAGTSGTDADQQNRNLLLGKTARADTRPWLQIDADDVACTHGATVGRLDEDGLFYLRSRGIPKRSARSMLVSAFAEAAFDEILRSGPGRDWLMASTASAIGAVLEEAHE